MDIKYLGGDLQYLFVFLFKINDKIPKSSSAVCYRVRTKYNKYKNIKNIENI